MEMVSSCPTRSEMLQLNLYHSIATDKNEAFLASTTVLEKNNADFNKREGTWLQIIFTTPTALRTEVRPYCSKWKKLEITKCAKQSQIFVLGCVTVRC